MARRTRSILVDNTLGKIFTNTDVVTTTDASKLIAGTKIQSSTISASSKTTAIVAKNIGTGVGIPFANNGLITNVTLSATSACAGQSIIVAIKVGSTYNTSTTATTVSLPVNSYSASTAASVSVQAGQNVYLDITQVGTTKPGVGLSVRLDYYTG